jgi:glutamine synthetase
MIRDLGVVDNPQSLATLATVNHHGQLIGKVIAELGDGSPLQTSLRDYLLANDLNHNEIRAHVPGRAAHPWFSGYGSVLLKEDRSVAPRSALPFTERLCFADAFDLAGEEIGVASRAVVRHVVRVLDGLGFRALVATELEFYLLPEDIGTYGDAQLTGLFQSDGTGRDGLIEFPAAARAVIRELAEACGRAGITVEGYSQETGCRQYELNFAPADPVTACDSHVLFKHLARCIAREHGCVAVFMAKPATAAMGSSCHVNFSLTEGTEQLDLIPAACGLLRELPVLSLLLLPYANSYRRLGPGSSLARLSLGRDRSTAVRVTDGRAEVRVAGADANPYLAVSAVLAAAVCGIKSSSAGAADGEASAAMPLSIESAIEAATRESPAWEVLPGGLREHVVELAALECEVDRRQVTEFDRARLLSRI